MQVIIKPSKVSGEIIAPASKSSMQRACAAALIRKGETIIHNAGKSNDDKAALRVIRILGARILQPENDSLQIVSEGVNSKNPSGIRAINCGESGLSIRMFTPIAALSEKKTVINGEGSLLNRPMNFFDEILPQLNVKCKTNNGKLPIEIQGALQPKNIEIDGSLSSQFLTGLLLAYSAADAKDVTIKVKDLKSKPYIDLTLKMMESFLLKVPENQNHKEFYFDNLPINQLTNQPINYTVESDWSGGAFLLVAGAIAGNIVVKGLDAASTQADKRILKALLDCGCKISIQSNQIEIGAGNLKAFFFNATDCPDLFPPLVALAAYCVGTTVIEGVHRLTHKESNRALTLQKEFSKMGVEIILQDNEMLVNGGGKIKSATVHSNHDHRIAMACAVAALKADGEIIVEEADAINKSYPDFYEHLRRLGVTLKINE
ncbi:MAG: 3-phosphoshikimate 1-carboxyvinyltransferase [Chitinophagaceae bacterium]